ncbi:hypothetical protein GMA8713_01033 [Grimontia marina]|uniref:Uncharacterized protein n=1 Tax=Grimontia marina TaxID=646534 RepID=A0A128EYC5_9GAMM|nr:hypothetical protein GMA8713_01033 [Grimontia marina]
MREVSSRPEATLHKQAGYMKANLSLQSNLSSCKLGGDHIWVYSQSENWRANPMHSDETMRTLLLIEMFVTYLDGMREFNSL